MLKFAKAYAQRDAMGNLLLKIVDAEKNRIERTRSLGRPTYLTVLRSNKENFIMKGIVPERAEGKILQGSRDLFYHTITFLI